MKTPSHSSDTNLRCLRAAFTLTETVIAIGVLAVVLTGFIAVFTPAAQGIRRSISSEQADRLTTTLEMELATLRESQKATLLPTGTTGFDKSFGWIRSGNVAANAIFVYQYRGNPAIIRGDGTPEPMVGITGEPGKSYIVQSMARRVGEKEGGKDLLEEDLKALEGSVFFVKPTQLIYMPDPNDESIPPKDILGLSKVPGEIQHQVPDTTNGGYKLETATNANTYNEAVISFSVEFHSVPTKTFSYLSKTGTDDPFTTRFNSTTNKPIFTRNLAVRR
jgi:hypothetical protein